MTRVFPGVVCLIGFAAGMLTISLCAASTAIQDSGSVATEVADLKDQLEKGLKARRPEEFKFIANAVNLVNNGRLPLKLVKGTFDWARRRAKVKRYPFPYFEQALRKQAAELGVVIP